MKGTAQAAQSLLPSWGMFAMSPEMMHPPKAAPWLCTRAVSPEVPLNTPAGHRAVTPSCSPKGLEQAHGMGVTASWGQSKADGQAGKKHPHSPRCSSTERGLCSKG